MMPTRRIYQKKGQMNKEATSGAGTEPQSAAGAAHLNITLYEICIDDEEISGFRRHAAG